MQMKTSVKSDIEIAQESTMKPIVEIEANAIICSRVARIGVRGKNLKPVRETLVGPQQYALVGRTTRPFLDVDRP